MADTEAMFHQVRAPAKDSNLLRFLWWPSGDFSKHLMEDACPFLWSKGACPFLWSNLITKLILSMDYRPTWSAVNSGAKCQTNLTESVQESPWVE